MTPYLGTLTQTEAAVSNRLTSDVWHDYAVLRFANHVEVEDAENYGALCSRSRVLFSISGWLGGLVPRALPHQLGIGQKKKPTKSTRITPSAWSGATTSSADVDEPSTLIP